MARWSRRAATAGARDSGRDHGHRHAVMRLPAGDAESVNCAEVEVPILERPEPYRVVNPPHRLNKLAQRACFMTRETIAVEVAPIRRHSVPDESVLCGKQDDSKYGVPLTPPKAIIWLWRISVTDTRAIVPREESREDQEVVEP